MKGTLQQVFPRFCSAAASQKKVTWTVKQYRWTFIWGKPKNCDSGRAAASKKDSSLFIEERFFPFFSSKFYSTGHSWFQGEVS